MPASGLSSATALHGKHGRCTRATVRHVIDTVRANADKLWLEETNSTTYCHYMNSHWIYYQGGNATGRVPPSGTRYLTSGNFSASAGVDVLLVRPS